MSMPETWINLHFFTSTIGDMCIPQARMTERSAMWLCNSDLGKYLESCKIRSLAVCFSPCHCKCSCLGFKHTLNYFCVWRSRQKGLVLALEKAERKEVMILPSSLIQFPLQTLSSSIQLEIMCTYTHTHSQGEKVQSRSLALDVIMP